MAYFSFALHSRKQTPQALLRALPLHKRPHCCQQLRFFASTRSTRLCAKSMGPGTSAPELMLAIPKHSIRAPKAEALATQQHFGAFPKSFIETTPAQLGCGLHATATAALSVDRR